MMHRLPAELRARLRALFRRTAVERELDEELHFHLEQETAKYVRAGVPPVEAERRARAAFGGVSRIKDDARDARGVALLESLAQDLRYAVRGLRNSPAFTIGVVITLGLGLGANAAMFGVVDRLLLRPPAELRDPAHVHRVYLHSTVAREHRVDRNVQFPRYRDFAALSRTVSAVAAFQPRTLAVGSGADVEQLQVTVASASYFDFFDARPLLGRFFGPADDSVPAGAPVAVLGYAYWQTHFGGRPDVLGEKLQVDRSAVTIIGVAPRHFVGLGDGGEPALFLPATTLAYAMRRDRYVNSYGWSWLELMVRRRDGVTVSQAEADLTHAYEESWRREAAASGDTPDVEAGQPTVELAPVQLARGPDAGIDAKVIRWVAGVSAIVLLIACANVANLLLARALARRREIAMRLALGVSRGRLVRQLLTETLLLSLLGGAAGLLIAQWGAAWLRRMFLPVDTATAVLADPRTLLFAAFATTVVALLTAILPAIQSGRISLAPALRGGGRESQYRRSRARTVLLVVQAALSVVLLVGAGLFVLSLRHARGYPLGYEPASLLYASINRRGTDSRRRREQGARDASARRSARDPGRTWRDGRGVGPLLELRGARTVGGRRGFGADARELPPAGRLARVLHDHGHAHRGRPSVRRSRSRRRAAGGRREHRHGEGALARPRCRGTVPQDQRPRRTVYDGDRCIRGRALQLAGRQPRVQLLRARRAVRRLPRRATRQRPDGSRER